MARRRHRRRNPINNADYMPIAIGVVGGAMAMYLYLKSAASTPASSSSLVFTPPAGGTTTTSTTG